VFWWPIQNTFRAVPEQLYQYTRTRFHWDIEGEFFKIKIAKPNAVEIF